MAEAITNYIKQPALVLTMVTDHRERILQFIKAKGPILPGQVAKEIGTDMIMASAHLAELTATKKLKISHIKVGGSPLYFLEGQEEKLHDFIGSFNDKEKKAYDLLNEKKVLRENELEPVIRVALRGMKDFAMPLTVSHNGTSETFWRWHLAIENEVEQLIRKKLGIPQEKTKEELQKELPVENEAQKPALKQLPQKKETKARARKASKQESDFIEHILEFFAKNNVKILSQEMIKKDYEMDFLIEIPSVMGNLKYYCKAKSKKKINDSDLSSAFVKGQYKKLSVIFLTDGELSPKASDMLNAELNNMTFKKI